MAKKSIAFIIILSACASFLMFAHSAYADDKSCFCTGERTRCLTLKWGSYDKIESDADCQNIVSGSNGPSSFLHYNSCRYTSDSGSCAGTFTCNGKPCTASDKECSTNQDCAAYGANSFCRTADPSATSVENKVSDVCFFDADAMNKYKSIPKIDNPLAHFELKAPVIRINIPGVSFTKVENTVDSNGNIILPWIGEYIAGVYKYAMVIGSIIAVVLIIMQGMQVVMSAGGEQKSEAYSRILSIGLGLIILWGSYAILYTINPELVALKSLSIKYIEPIAYEYAGDTDKTIDINNLDKNIYCPKTGGAAAIPKIVAGLAHKVSYRYGGGGGPPPYKETNPDYIKYNSFCPTGTVCLDCSGFVNIVYMCAGIPSPGGWTGSIFKDSEAIKPNMLDAKNNMVNGIKLQPGDLIGWPSNESRPIGHVVMYLGDGQVAESKGGKAGRDPGGSNPRVSRLSDLKYPFDSIRRIPENYASKFCCIFPDNKGNKTVSAEAECAAMNGAQNAVPGDCSSVSPESQISS